jgi:hypothetical protein
MLNKKQAVFGSVTQTVTQENENTNSDEIRSCRRSQPCGADGLAKMTLEPQLHDRGTSTVPVCASRFLFHFSLGGRLSWWVMMACSEVKEWKHRLVM